MCSNSVCVCLHLAVFTDFNNTLVLAKPGKQNTLSFKKDKCVTWETTSSTEKKQTYFVFHFSTVSDNNPHKRELSLPHSCSKDQ